MSIERGRTCPSVLSGADVFGDVAETLGVTPDSRVKVLVCVEGPTDVLALKHLSCALHQEDPKLPNLLVDDRVAFVPLGGGTLKHWVAENYLQALRLPEIHIYDRDVKEYADKVALVNARPDGRGSSASQTLKYEIECYLHPGAIFAAYGITIQVVDYPAPGMLDVPAAFGRAIMAVKNYDGIPKPNTVKQWLAANAFPRMTAKMLHERDPAGEVRGWMERIQSCIEGGGQRTPVVATFVPAETAEPTVPA